MTTQTKEFSGWRALLWPIHFYELKKFLPMFLLFFLINFNYTILRDTKDALLVTAPGSGAEAIPFLKTWGVLPFAILFTLLYSQLSNLLSKENLFYVTIMIFIAFFILFALFLYPNHSSLHPHAFADRLQRHLPIGMKGLIALIRNWTYALFYIMAELWGSVAISLLFWGFANDITKLSESRRFYGLLGIGANCALLVSGPTIIFCSRIRSRVAAGIDPWRVSLTWMLAAVVLSSLLIMATYRWMQVNVLTDRNFYDPHETQRLKKSRPKMSLKESFAYLMQSPYVLCLAILVVSYGVGIQLVEVPWKAQLGKRFSNPNDYSAFMGLFSTITGAVTICMMLFLSSNIIRYKGWIVAALATPIVFLVTGVAFFSSILLRPQLATAAALLQMTPLHLAVLLGAAQNILTKSCKYSLFDPSKEIAYIPTDEEVRVKGKAAVDVVGARFGKAGGAFLNQLLLLIAGSALNLPPYSLAFVVAISYVWIRAVQVLNPLFLEAQSRRQQQLASSA